MHKKHKVTNKGWKQQRYIGSSVNGKCAFEWLSEHVDFDGHCFYFILFDYYYFFIMYAMYENQTTTVKR